jgi:hypothetical protein
MTTINEAFGCTACLPQDAESAWEIFRTLAIDARLVDESHFRVLLRRCPKCQQRFVSAFMETIDWVDGEDPQFSSVIPVTTAEADQLIQAGDQVESQLETLAPARRSLCHYFPKGESPRSFWRTGFVIAPHD